MTYLVSRLHQKGKGKFMAFIFLMFVLCVVIGTAGAGYEGLRGVR